MCQEPFLDKSGKLQALWCLDLLLSLPEGRSIYKPSQTDRNESFCSQHSEKGIPVLFWEPLMGSSKKKMEEKEKLGNTPSLFCSSSSSWSLLFFFLIIMTNHLLSNLLCFRHFYINISSLSFTTTSRLSPF